MGRQTFYPTRLPFVADPHSIMRLDGRQIDWANVPNSYRNGAVKVTVGAAGAAIGATAIPVDALPGAIPAGEVLNFGTYAPVTVTVNGAASAGATSITVQALSGPIPSGTVLNFTGAGEFAVLTAAAAAGATSLTVEALDAAIEDTDTALFPGGTKMARLTAAAAAGATSLTVDELQFALVNDEVAYYGGTGQKSIPAGKVMCELASGKVCPRDSRPGSETAMALLETTAIEGEPSQAKTGFGMIVGGVIYENLLPDASGGTISSTYKTELQTAGVGTGFAWQQYADNRS
jgi:hypothetical protein